MKSLSTRLAGVTVVLAMLGPTGFTACGGGDTSALPTGKVSRVTLGEKDPCCDQKAEVCVIAESDQKSGQKGPGALEWKKGKEYCHGNYDPSYLKNCKAGKFWPGCYGKEN